MKEKKQPKKHIKLYASDEMIAEIKAIAESKGMSHSAYLLMLTRKDAVYLDRDAILRIK